MRSARLPYRCFLPHRSLLAALLLTAVAPAAFAIDVRICTSQGIVELELDERNAAPYARNFARYADAGFYNGTVIHRSVAGSMLQGGGYDASLERRQPNAPVAGEFANGLSNQRGTIAASRSAGASTVTSQFFINLADNPHLDAAAGNPGFTVFGRVTAGLDVLDAIAGLPTRRVGDLEEVPVPLIELESVTVLERESLFGLSVEPDPAALEAGFNAAQAGGNAGAVLAAVRAMRRACQSLTTAQYLAEAEAALAAGQIEQARYSVEQLLARATALDPLLPRAQRLYAGLPTATNVNFEQRLAECRRPQAPSVPDGRTSELGTLQAIESEVRRYRQLGETYLGCVDRIIHSGELNELETIAATEQYNDVVIELTATTSRFNQAAADFRASR
jgi:cyclophilin family peptidyl-prolyl cis-trans isomerase